MSKKIFNSVPSLFSVWGNANLDLITVLIVWIKILQQESALNFIRLEVVLYFSTTAPKSNKEANRKGRHCASNFRSWFVSICTVHCRVFKQPDYLYGRNQSCTPTQCREYWMIYRWRGFLNYDLAPRSPHPSVSDTQEDWENRDTSCWRTGGGGGGREAELIDRKKA